MNGSGSGLGVLESSFLGEFEELGSRGSKGFDDGNEGKGGFGT